jgi:hypothetical protein
MSPNPITDETNQSAPAVELDSSMDDTTDEFPHTESPETAVSQNRSVNSTGVVKPPRNPKDHGIDGAE